MVQCGIIVTDSAQNFWKPLNNLKMLIPKPFMVSWLSENMPKYLQWFKPTFISTVGLKANTENNLDSSWDALGFPKA